MQSAEQYQARTEAEFSTQGLLEDSFLGPAVASLPFAVRGQVDILGEAYGAEASSAVTAMSAALLRLNLPSIPALAGRPEAALCFCACRLCSNL